MVPLALTAVAAICCGFTTATPTMATASGGVTAAADPFPASKGSKRSKRATTGGATSFDYWHRPPPSLEAPNRSNGNNRSGNNRNGNSNATVAVLVKATGNSSSAVLGRATAHRPLRWRFWPFATAGGPKRVARPAPEAIPIASSSTSNRSNGNNRNGNSNAMTYFFVSKRGMPPILKHIRKGGSEMVHCFVRTQAAGAVTGGRSQRRSKNEPPKAREESTNECRKPAELTSPEAV